MGSGADHKLSERLKAVASMARMAVEELRAGRETERISVADIGTDHAYLPIFLLQDHLVDRVIASDAKEGPLSRARKHVEEAGLTEGIELRISDGFEAYTPGEVQVAVLSGMGGRLIQQILTAHLPQLLGIRQLILQPQSEAKELWHYLKDTGWQVIDERMVYEDQKFYTMMRAVPAGGSIVRQTEDFGQFLSAGRDETWHLFLEKEKAANQQLIEKIEEQNGPKKRLEELTHRQQNIDAALSVFRNDRKSGGE